MIYDSPRGRALLFGGFGGGNRNDTWEWDGTTWVDRTPASVKPPAAIRSTSSTIRSAGHAALRRLPAGAAARVRRHLAVERRDADVEQSDSVAESRTLVGHAMTFDTDRGTVLLFGGGGGPALSSDTWEWNGTSWKKR